MEILSWKKFIHKLDHWLYESNNLRTIINLKCNSEIASFPRMVNISQLNQYLRLKADLEKFYFEVSLFKQGATVTLRRDTIQNVHLPMSVNYLITSKQELHNVLGYKIQEDFNLWTDNKRLVDSRIRYLPQGLSLSEKKNYVINKVKTPYIILLHSRIYLKDFRIHNTRYPITAAKVIYHGNQRRYLDFEHVSNFWPWNFLKKYTLFPTNSILKLDGAVIMGRKQALIKYPLNPCLDWGEGEDVWWSSSLALHAVCVNLTNDFVYSMTSKWTKRSFLIPAPLKKYIWLIKHKVI